MPIYEYQCQACGKQVEAFQKITEEPLKICPHCQADALNKLISATSFQLKGTGWYATDIRDKGKPKESTSNDVAKSTETPAEKPKSDDKSGSTTGSSSSSSAAE